MKEFKGTDRHMQNFIDVVRSRKDGGPVRPDRGRPRLERALPPRQHLAPDRRRRPGRTRLPRQIKSDAKLGEAYGRMVEHLHANNVDLNATPLTLGVPLIVDAQERDASPVPNAERANKLLTAEYRAPFTVPSIA